MKDMVYVLIMEDLEYGGEEFLGVFKSMDGAKKEMMEAVKKKLKDLGDPSYYFDGEYRIRWTDSVDCGEDEYPAYDYKIIHSEIRS